MAEASPPFRESRIRQVDLVVGMEVHVELATRSKMFSRAPSPAHALAGEPGPNTLIDPVVLGLPGALPVMNRAAVEMAMMVGLALNCSIATYSKWDRKSYFYPDLPKAYQISQYDLPLCFDGSVEVPGVDERGFIDPAGEVQRVRIIRAHLEEDAGKLLHEAPGGGAIDFSIVDYNRAGTPLLEIVTRPDFGSVERVVTFARMLRNICRFLGASEGVMQKGHMRFEPNINCILTLEDGRRVRTPIVEIKNLNSFKSLKGAIEHELAEQPRRWLEDGRELAPGAKTTRGWDDVRGVTFLQREKEEAQDYRYFPDPDLPPVVVSESWRAEVAGRVPELPVPRLRRYMAEYGLDVKEAAAITEERDLCLFYESCIVAIQGEGIGSPRAGRVAANFLLQAGAKRANERGVMAHELGITAAQVAAIARLREGGAIGSNAADELFGLCCEPGGAGLDPAAEARSRGMIIVRDAGTMEAWIEQVIAANPKVAEDVRGGKLAAAGRLVGEVMKLSGGKADAKGVREEILRKLMPGESGGLNRND
jgi:aspartyl-tRNA(Asn)/glutamyl-tRNA(Gln) amidotransferase subunit B